MFCVWKKKSRKEALYRRRMNRQESLVPMFDFHTIEKATENFSWSNCIGHGAFGPVYKGILPGGQKVAVKRLSKSSGQGMEEFKNEVTLIAKLQHRNLVRLLGFCIRREDKMLVYEFMPNRSLNDFLRDASRKHMLDWKTRYNIIDGIIRGLIYLHRDSRLRIIHRDLKASDILLDEDMNPKISDFGMSRIFVSDSNETSTDRVVGSSSCMAPEYVMQGLFSVKTDVYSFGVLLIEIVSGKRASAYYNRELDLLAYAWKLWNDDNVMELVDPSIRNSCSLRVVSRCINVGLLCIQDRANDRPTMSSVILMLKSESSSYPKPKRPTFAAEMSQSKTGSSTLDQIGASADASITMLIGR